MTGYIQYPLTVDYDTIVANALDELVGTIPGWLPAEGHLEVQLIEVLARMVSETQIVASNVPTTIFRYFGKTLLNIPAIDAAPASMNSTWTLADTLGHTISAGTIVSYPQTGDINVFFRVQSDVVVDPGSSTTAAGEVVLVALDAGTAANGLVAGAAQVVDALAWVTSIATTTTSSGGVDAEGDVDYLNRLAAELQLLSPRPILPNDFAVLARRIAGVARSVAIDGYNPADSSTGNERMVAVAVADVDGAAVSSGVKSAVDAYLQSLREVNFVVNVVDPTYTSVAVTATVKKLATADATVVHDDAVAALQAYLSPATWNWASVVRYNELIVLLDQIPGVDYVTSITVPSGNVTLTGVGALPTAGTMSITVT